jgi:hypothetical protein
LKPNPSPKAHRQTSSATHPWFKPLRPEAVYVSSIWERSELPL